MRRSLLFGACLIAVGAAAAPARAQFYGWGGYQVIRPYPYAAYPYSYPAYVYPYPAYVYPYPAYPPPYVAPPVYPAPLPYGYPRAVSLPVPRWHPARPIHRTRLVSHRQRPRPAPRGLINPLLGPLPTR